MKRTASCCCGRLRVICEGEPVRISVCHCRECQKRTGSAFGAQTRFADSNIGIEGEVRHYRRTADSGSELDFRFCGSCGSTVFWTNQAFPGFTMVALGAFADPTFARPRFSVYESRRHGWVHIPGDEVERMD
jgi:hypothetical protein